MGYTLHSHGREKVAILGRGGMGLIARGWVPALEMIGPSRGN